MSDEVGTWRDRVMLEVVGLATDAGHAVECVVLACTRLIELADALADDGQVRHARAAVTAVEEVRDKLALLLPPGDDGG